MSAKIAIFCIICSFFLGIAMALGVLYILNTCKMPNNYVQIIIYNKSHFTIKELTITYSSGKTIYTQQLPPNESTFFAFPQQSEGSYRIVARTTNNDILEGGGGYIEAGYVEENTILDGHIINGTDLNDLKPH